MTSASRTRGLAVTRNANEVYIENQKEMQTRVNFFIASF